MNVELKDITVFKVKNRRGYAAIFQEHLTEGDTENEALERMVKALRRTSRQPVSLAAV